MQYAEYRKKMLKLKSVLGVIKRFRVLIICACLFAVALVTTLLSVRGIVYEVADCPENIVYGDNLGFKAKAVMYGVKYQYAEAGSDEWSTTQPTRAGSYKVRPYSKSVAGTTRYGKEHTFTILQRQIEIKAADTAVYGDCPALVGDLASGDSASCTVFTYGNKYAESTNVLPDKNSIVITDKNGEDVTSCYVLQPVESQITLTKRTVTVAAASAEKEYDGMPLSANGYDLRGTSLAFDDKINYSGCEGSRTDAGSADNKIVGEIRIVNGDGDDVTDRYNLKTAYGLLTVTRRKVSVTSSDAQKVYDGEALACLEYSDNGRLLSGHGLQVTSFTGLVDAGERDNVLGFIVRGGNEMDYTANYDIQLTAGKLTVTRRPVTVITPDHEWEYDAGKHSDNNFYYSAEKGKGLVTGHTDVIKQQTTVLNAGTAENAITIAITNGYADVTANYDISYEYGTLTVTPRPVTIIADSAEKEYDGTPLTCGTVSDGNNKPLISNDVIFAETTGSRTEVGGGVNRVVEDSVKIYSNRLNCDVTKNYKITFETGTLTVTRRAVTISADDAQKVYDGTALTCATLSGDRLVAGHTVTGQTYGSGIDAGEYVNSVKEGTVKICGADGKDLTSNYSITLADGTLTVTQRPVTVMTSDGEWIYDDEAHYNPTYKIAAALDFALVSGHRAVVDSFDEITDAGEIENVLNIKIFAGAVDKTANYAITYDYGTLTVKPRPVTITTASAGKTYDGTPLTCEKYTITYSLSPAFVKDHYEQVTFTGGLTYAGQGKNTAEVKVLTADGKEVTSNYDVTVNEGELFVYKRDITIASRGGSWQYDGAAHSRQAYEVLNKGLGLAQGDAVVVDTAAVITDVGAAKNVITVKITRSGTDVTSSYNITYEYGTLTITARPVTVTADSAEKEYDGTPLTCGTVSGSNLVPVTGHIVTARTSGSQTDIGQSANRVISGSVVIRDEGGKDVTSNYKITLADGVLKVTQREITVRAGDSQKVYDGDPLTCSLYAVVSETRLLTGHTLTAQTYGSQTDAGEGVNAIVEGSVRITDSYGRNVSDRYAVSYEEGALTVMPRTITVVASDAEKEYDGTPLTYGEFKVLSIYDPALVKDHKLTAVINSSRTDAGESANVIESVTINSASGDVTDNYAIILEPGTLKVTGRKITVTTADGEWVYDGGRHTNTHLECEGLLKGHTAQCSYVVGITSAGSCPNANGIKIVCGEENVTANYDITYVYGTLTVTKREVHLTSADGEWVYDNEVHTKKQADVDGDSPYGLVEGHSLVCAVVTGIVTVGEVENRLTLNVTDGAEHDLTLNYDLHLTCGTLKVTKRPVTITYKYDSIYFTGAPVNQVVTTSYYFESVSDYPLLDDTDVIVTVLCDEYALGAATLYFQEGSARIVNRKNYDLSENFEITLLSKQVNIVKRKIRIESAEAEKVYDGTPLTAERYNIYKNTTSSYPFISYATVDGHEVELSVTFTGSQTKIGESLNTFTVDVGSFKVFDADGNDITYGYDYVERYGTLYVTKFGSLYVTTASAEKIYDGTPLTNGDYKVTSTLLDGYTYEITVTGSRTEVGSSDNTFEVVVYSPEGVDVTDGLRLVSYYGLLKVREKPSDGNHTIVDVDTSGNIGGGGSGSAGSGSDAVAMKLYSDISGTVYMRLTSYGGYTGKGWNPASPYNLTIDGKYGMNYLTGFALGGAGRNSTLLQIVSAGSMYYLPYYPDSGDYNYKIQQSDVLYTGDTGSIYSLNYYPYDYLKEGAVKLTSESLIDVELEYRQFVYDNYLSVPAGTAEYLQTVIAAQRFNKSDSALVAKIAAYVQNVATYNLNYNTALDNESDAVVSFLRDYKEGVCRHYASAATLLYRMMGIPARYTIGYLGTTVAGEWTEVSADKAHAWVEIYVDGMGWVQIEVTGTDDSGYEEIDLGNLDPANVTKEYDGTPLKANRLVESGALAEYLAKGFTYEAQFGGSQTNVGTSYSWVTGFTLYDPSGKPILKGVNWASGSGKLTVVAPDTLIVVHLYYLGVEYDGRAHSLGSGDWYAEGLPAGCRIEFDPSLLAVTEAGGFKWSDVKALPLKMYNASGLDVTANYNIIFSDESEDGGFGEGIDVSRRQLTICTQTAEKEYDGTPLTSGEWWISFGTLADGHKISVTVAGSITDAGKTENIIGSCKIYDKDGRDVTGNYSLDLKCGTLTVID